MEQVGDGVSVDEEGLREAMFTSPSTLCPSSVHRASWESVDTATWKMKGSGRMTYLGQRDEEEREIKEGEG